MLKEKNECIAARAFAALILDYEWSGDAILPPCVSCRILIEDLCVKRIHANSREHAIQLFNSGAWKEM